MEHLVSRRYWWFALSLLMILPGLYFLLLHPLVTTGQFRVGLRPSIDFSGGSLWELRFADRAPGEVRADEVAAVFAEQGFEGAQVQLSQVEIEGRQVADALVRTRPISADTPLQETQAVEAALQAAFGSVTRERLESVGPTVSAESTRSAVIAVLGASTVILLYLTWAFRKAPHPLRYGVCAILAMLHDVLVVLGIAAMLSAFNPRFEVDALFLTALLTILSFSVHDTIVVFDRIRENLINRRPGETFDGIVNHSIVQTLPRSINTQLTTFFTLTALLLFGGESIRNFVLIMLIGLVSGTYSSIFNAAQLLVVWEHQEWRRWFGGGRRPDAEEPTPAVSQG
ncbi:MAG: protein translocase subunit SecF [Chloroflexi bacterium OHK40]